MSFRLIHRLNQHLGWLFDGLFAIALGALTGIGAAWALECCTSIFR